MLAWSVVHFSDVMCPGEVRNALVALGAGVVNLVGGEKPADVYSEIASSTSSAAIEVDTLEKLKSEVSELQIQLPEIEMLGNLTRQVESCSLGATRYWMQLELFLEEMDGFTVNVPELKLLRQYQNDAITCTRRSHVICTTCEGTL
ncbi:hypothetical protein POM88_035531 [Heracleum sosnowskyi]|uniref:Uncharacterized protein n=1 Tax=Heracleum sosnowskyi TaxID=360622 RepID=A0AAD8ME66_9APIA|nr:hypothetical protein POM88_035531 [Heracleum sosnowskyi]